MSATKEIWDLLIQRSENDRYAYRASGNIVFRIVPTKERDSSSVMKAALRALIVGVDKQHPWVAKRGTGEPVPSIWVLGYGYDQFNNWTGGELNIGFSIEPFGCMSRGEFYAYEKYLRKLAQELSLIVPDEINEVSAGFNVHRHKTFSTVR